MTAQLVARAIIRLLERAAPEEASALSRALYKANGQDEQACAGVVSANGSVTPVITVTCAICRKYEIIQHQIDS